VPSLALFAGLILSNILLTSTIGPLPVPAGLGLVSPVMSKANAIGIVATDVSTYALFVTSVAVVGVATPVIFDC